MELTIRGTQTNRLDRWSLLMVLTLGLMLGTLGFSLWDKMPSTVERVAWAPEAQWIAPKKNSDILAAPLNPGIVGSLDTIVFEGAAKMSGFVVTERFSWENFRCKLGKLL